MITALPVQHEKILEALSISFAVTLLKPITSQSGEAPDVLAECAGLATMLTCCACHQVRQLDVGIDAVGATVTRNLCDCESGGALHVTTRNAIAGVHLLGTHLDKHLGF